MHIMEERDDLEFLDVIIIIVGFAVIILRFRSGSLDLWAFFGIFLFCIYLVFRIGGFLFARARENKRLAAEIMTLQASVADFEPPAEPNPVLQYSGVFALLALAGYIIGSRCKSLSD